MIALEEVAVIEGRQLVDVNLSGLQRTTHITTITECQGHAKSGTADICHGNYNKALEGKHC